MAQTITDYKTNVDATPVPLLERVRSRGRVWADLSKQYGVDNPNPPWKLSLDGICDALDEQSCALPGLERRWEEDRLSADLYADLPFPERQLLTLAHSMIKRNLISEDELAERMKQVDKKLNVV